MANDNSSESMGIMRLAMKGSQLTEHKPVSSPKGHKSVSSPKGHKPVSSPKGHPPSSKLHNTRHDSNYQP